FKLIKSQATGTGVIVATYERAGEVKVGSFVTGEPSEAELERRKNWK
ncbi:dihydrofolate reductase, partial [Mesorhizobium sp. M7A.F.Ca.CA.002.03.2.1]